MGFSVLAVDDSLAVRMSLRDLLSQEGFEVRLASRADEAEEILARDRFDLVVLDFHLADGASTPLLRKIQGGAFGTKTPVLVISGSESTKTRLDSLRGGASDFIAKPYDRRFVSKRARELIAGPAAFPSGPYRALVVDDSLTYGHAVAQELAKDGHDVVLAPTAADALAYLELQRPDLLLLDVFLPDVDGIELARKIRADERLRDVPLLMLTGRESTLVRQRAVEANVSEFLPKSAPLSTIREWASSAAAGRLGAPLGSYPLPAEKTSPRLRAIPEAPVEAQGETLFLRVVAASGLSEVLGRSTIGLALRRAGADPDTLTSESLSDSLGQIERMLTTFLPAEDVRGRLSAISALAKQGSSNR